MSAAHGKYADVQNWRGISLGESSFRAAHGPGVADGRGLPAAQVAARALPAGRAALVAGVPLQVGFRLGHGRLRVLQLTQWKSGIHSSGVTKI